MRTRVVSGRHFGGSVWGCPRAICAAALALGFSWGPALADLKLCNTTTGRIGVSIGYRDAKGWTTEGWWNIVGQTCETLLKGTLPSRFVYVHAIDYDRGGTWAGENMMCTTDKSFAIHGVVDCPKRGFVLTGFFEVDTGNAKEWTIQLTEPDPAALKKK